MLLENGHRKIAQPLADASEVITEVELRSVAEAFFLEPHSLIEQSCGGAVPSASGIYARRRKRHSTVKDPNEGIRLDPRALDQMYSRSTACDEPVTTADPLETSLEETVPSMPSKEDQKELRDSDGEE